MPPVPPKQAKSVFTQLPADGEEFIGVQQYLSSCLLLKGKIEGVSILKIDNPELTSRFDKKTQKLMKLIGWSNMKNLQADNTDLSLLGKRGFVFGKGTGGLDFLTGNIHGIDPVHKLNQNKNTLVELHEPEHTLLYSDVAVGRSFVQDKNWQTTNPPEGYDSFYMPSVQLDRNDDGEFDLFEYQQAASFDNREPETYEHRYFIKDPTLALPRYVIRFKFASPAASAASADNQPGASARKPAQTKASLASSMDEKDFFDPETHRPVTMREKVKLGGTKLILPVQNAYEQALVDWQREDPLIQGKKEWLESQLDSIDEKVRMVNLNYADVLEKIQESAEAATRHLQALTKTKLDTLLSVEVELRRQKEQMLWMDSLVEKHFTSVRRKIEDAHKLTNADEDAPSGEARSHVDVHAAHREVTDSQLEFLQIWKHHTTFRNAATRLKPRQHMDALNLIKPDIAIKADLNIYIDQSINRGAAAAAAAGGGGSSEPKSQSEAAAAAAREPVVATADDKAALKSTLISLKTYNNYSRPPRPTEDLLSHLLQSVVDVEAANIQEILSEALQDDRIPLPASLHRPAAAGANYAPRNLMDLLTPPPPPGSANEAVNHKELYYASMKAALGTPPPAAKDMPRALTAKEREAAESRHHHHHGHHKDSKDNKDNKDKRGHNESKKDGRQSPTDAFARAAEEREEKKKEDAAEERRLWQERELERLKKLQEEQQEQHRQQLLRLQQQQAVQAYSNADHATPSSHALPFFTSLTDPQLKKGMSRLTTDNGSHSAVEESGVDDAANNKSAIQYTGVQFEVATLQTLAKKFRSGFSLSLAATRRIGQLRTDSARDTAAVNIGHLATSHLLTPGQAQTLYYSLPFFAKPPSIELLYSSVDKEYTGIGLNLEELYTASMMSNNASLLLIQSGDFLFGAYLSHPLRVMGSGWTGSPACFLFSVTLDVKIPYHARNPPSGTDSSKKPVAFLAQRDKITIGNGDLVINSEGRGYSNLENCYGMGLTYGSSEAACFLAGSREFVIDDVELWQIAP